MKIISIVGARPQFIKLAPLSKELRKKHKEIIVHTGQHYDLEMSKNFFKELSLPEPDYNLGVGSGWHGEQTGRMLKKIEEVLIFERPDLVIVYGDTNSTLAGGLASAKLDIPVAHIEAGLRSFKKSMPEEINRLLVDHLSAHLFCPTKTAVDNLKNEGIKRGIHLVGDVMYDSLRENLKIAQKRSKILHELNLKTKDYFLVTIHRAENTNIEENLQKLVSILVALSKRVVFPVHPRTRKYLAQFGLWEKLSSQKNIILTSPVSYFDMLVLEKSAFCILTDSGGVQKEAMFLETFCLTLRDETEWIETVKSGWNEIVGLNQKRIKKALLGLKKAKPVPAGSQPLYKKGVSRRICQIICRG
jgi:UDP-N-acetylglucosamine 2-epimerase